MDSRDILEEILQVVRAGSNFPQLMGFILNQDDAHKNNFNSYWYHYPQKNDNSIILDQNWSAKKNFRIINWDPMSPEKEDKKNEETK
jgi:hypothetical protein